jgi:hypothetical protein
VRRTPQLAKAGALAYAFCTPTSAFTCENFRADTRAIFV